MRNNKLLKRIAIIVGVLVVFYAVARISGGFRVYKSETSGNSPGIEPNDYIYVSNWISYERFDFVCYDAIDPLFGPSTYTHRLCGLSGDTIEIINGDLIVNGNNADKELSVKHNYIVSRSTSYKIRNRDGIEYLFSNDRFSDSVIVAMEPRIVKSWMNARQIIDDPQFKVNSRFPSEWSMDNFGPIILGDGEIFLLGDNRNGSLDSRSNGPGKETDITGVVFNKN